MILGFDFLGFQAIKRFPTKNRIFLHVMQCTITKNSFLLVFYSYVLVFYPYVTGMYLVCTRMLLVCTRVYSYVLVCYSYVLVWCFSHDPNRHILHQDSSIFTQFYATEKSHFFPELHLLVHTINCVSPIGSKI